MKKEKNTPKQKRRFDIIFFLLDLIAFYNELKETEWYNKPRLNKYNNVKSLCFNQIIRKDVKYIAFEIHLRNEQSAFFGIHLHVLLFSQIFAALF